MIAQVFADAWQIHQRLNARSSQFVGRTDSGSKKQMWRCDRASAKDDFDRCVQDGAIHEFDCRGTGQPVRSPVEAYPANFCITADRQVGPLPGTG